MEFAEWALRELEKDAIFIFTNESYIECGGKPRKMRCHSRPKGERWQYDIVAQDPTVKFTYMIWGAIHALDDSEAFPLYIWTEESAPEEAAAEEQLALENAERVAATELRRAAALVPGTPEHAELIAANASVDTFNRSCPPRNRKYQWTPKRLFKPEILTRRKQKGKDGKGRPAIDWWIYRERVLRETLWPYIERLQARHPGRLFYIVKDNAGPHEKAHRIADTEAQSRGIRACKPWPPCSPDLNMVERPWRDLKNGLELYRLGSRGSSQETIQWAYRITRDAWLEMRAREQMPARAFKATLQECIRQGGDNNFNA